MGEARISRVGNDEQNHSGDPINRGVYNKLCVTGGAVKSCSMKFIVYPENMYVTDLISLALKLFTFAIF